MLVQKEKQLCCQQNLHQITAGKHGFDANASLLLTKRVPAVFYNTIRLCQFSSTL